jgi:large subunit GTPase 1
MQSITQENDLDAFLSTAALAGTDFTAERLNVKVIQNDYQNPFLISEQEEKDRIEKQEANVDKLSVPRRPHWEKSMTAEQVQRNEREAFLNWRRDMATLEDEQGLLLTPFEKNLEVWRQLWRVIERSQLIVQIVDARNPMLFRSADLEKYVTEVDENKANLLLINKADFLTVKQRKKWADYFDSQGIKYTFFSAALAAQKLQEEEEERQRQELEASLKAQQAKESDDDDSDDEEEEDSEVEDVVEEAKETEEKKEEIEKITDFLSKASLNVESVEKDDERTRLRTTTDLLDLLIEQTPVMKSNVLYRSRS